MPEEKSKKSKEMVVTPWEVSGDIDYKKLVKKFGTTLLTEKEIAVMDKYSKGKLHLLLRRGFRGPSGHTHLGHLVPWIFTKWLQDIFDVELYFQMTDDEKFLFSQKLTFQETKDYAYENAKDVMAVGFDPKKTHFIFDSQLTSTMYQIAVEVAKRTTFSTARAVFGFTNESNVGMIFYPSIQAMPCFLPSKLKGKNIPILIPAAIDQDPYWRITRDVAPKLGYYKPAAIHCKFFPGLAEGGKMSASEPDSCIFTTDSPKSASKKIMRSYTGGRATVEEQRELGGEPDKCNVYWYEYYLFEPDDKKIEAMRTNCLSGKLLCGQCKKALAEKVETFVAEHQERRNKFTTEMIDKMIIKE